jgi:deaminated glutathione amidase
VFGLMTCYDLRFPELARSLADGGSQVLLVCSSWGREHCWLRLG